MTDETVVDILDTLTRTLDITTKELEEQAKLLLLLTQQHEKIALIMTTMVPMLAEMGKADPALRPYLERISIALSVFTLERTIDEAAKELGH
jgi:hypothetical protein